MWLDLEKDSKGEPVNRPKIFKVTVYPPVNILVELQDTLLSLCTHLWQLTRFNRTIDDITGISVNGTFLGDRYYHLDLYVSDVVIIYFDMFLDEMLEHVQSLCDECVVVDTSCIGKQIAFLPQF